MRTVRNTVNTGRTVVCTIHQPSIDIFEVSFLLTMMSVSGVLLTKRNGRHSIHAGQRCAAKFERGADRHKPLRVA